MKRERKHISQFSKVGKNDNELNDRERYRNDDGKHYLVTYFPLNNVSESK
jgi:hypothetical protein